MFLDSPKVYAMNYTFYTSIPPPPSRKQKRLGVYMNLPSKSKDITYTHNRLYPPFYKAITVELSCIFKYLFPVSQDETTTIPNTTKLATSPRRTTDTAPSSGLPTVKLSFFFFYHHRHYHQLSLSVIITNRRRGRRHH